MNRFREGAKACDQIAEELRTSIRELESLPLVSVDSEALEIGSLCLDNLREARTAYIDLAAALREGVSLVEDANSWSTLVEATVVGTKRVNERQERFMKDIEKVNERLQDITKKGNKIDSEIRRVRITLTQRYKKDFPNLD